MYLEQIVQWGTAVAQPGASEDELRDCETSLGHAIPAELRALLAEANGIDGEYGPGLLWPVERIARDNGWFRSDPTAGELYMSFDSLVFFSDAGNGDLFFVSLAGNREVYCWDHENDSRTWVASTVLQFLSRWMSGWLTV